VDRELEVIRDEMEQTRANLADKLGALETQVRETVSSASETVTSTVEGVKEVVETVSDTVGSVTETFNISKHVEQMASMLPSFESLLPDVKEAGNTLISGLGGLAVGSVMSVVRDLVANNLPQDWQGEITKLVDQVTRQLGGKVQPVKQEHNGQDTHKQDEKQGEHKPQDRPEEQGRDNRTARAARPQPAYQG